jgi:hypothetical protein
MPYYPIFQIIRSDLPSGQLRPMNYSLHDDKSAFSIPIRTWSRGKVLAGLDSAIDIQTTSTRSTNNLKANRVPGDDDSCNKSLEGDLLEYFPPEPDEQDVKEVADDFPVDQEMIGPDEDISAEFEDFLKRNYPNDESLATRELQKLMSAYEFDKLEDDVQDMFEGGKAYRIASRMHSQPKLDMNIFNCGRYDDDRADAGSDNDYSVDVDDSEVDENTVDARMGGYDEEIMHEASSRNDDDINGKQGKINSYTKPGYVNGKKVPTSGYGPIDAQKKRQMMIWQERYKSFDAKAKLRDTLDDIALRKKIEEEAAAVQALKEEARKRKLREQIERSVLMKAADGSTSLATPSFLAPTKAYEQQSVAKAKRRQDTVIATSDEIFRQEEDRKARIGALRRKFKEKHRQELESLVLKKKEMDRKVSTDID